MLELGVEGTNSFLEGTEALLNFLIVPGCLGGKLSRFGQAGSERKRCVGEKSVNKAVCVSKMLARKFFCWLSLYFIWLGKRVCM